MNHRQEGVDHASQQTKLDKSRRLTLLNFTILSLSTLVHTNLALEGYDSYTTIQQALFRQSKNALLVASLSLIVELCELLVCDFGVDTRRMLEVNEKWKKR